MFTGVNVPYLTVAAFKAYPTYLDLQNLVSGDSVAAHQDAELYNMLLRATNWAIGQCNQPLHAHINVENRRLRPDRQGRLKWHPSDNPVKQVTALSYGYLPNALMPVTDLSGTWTEANRQIVFPLAPLTPQFGAIQFGTPAGQAEVYTTWTYIAGYVVTTLAAGVAAGASSLTVKDATGLVAGDVLRIWEPGVEEAVTVANSYVAGSTTVPLTAALANTHATGAGISQLPADAQQAIVNYTVALLLRPDTSREDAFPDAKVGASTRTEDSRKDGSGLVAEAVRLLRDGGYGRVR
jgi:hypothetical protein